MWYLIAIILILISFSLKGIFYYPHHFFLFDELNSVIISGKLFLQKFNPHWFIYPAFYFYILFSIYAIFSLFLLIITKIPFSNVKYLLYKFPAVYILSGRFLSLFFTILSVIFLYKIGKSLFLKKEIAYLPPLVFVFLYPVIYLSYHIKPDALMLSLLLAGYYFNLKKKEKLSYFLWGLSIGSKYNAAFLIFPFILSEIVFQKKMSFKIIRNSLILIFSFFLVNPFIILDSHKFWSDIKKVSLMVRWKGHLSYLNFHNSIFYTLETSLAQIFGCWGDYLLLLSLLLGIIFLLADKYFFSFYLGSLISIFLFAKGNILQINYFYPALPFFLLTIFYVWDRLKVPFLFILFGGITIAYAGFKESSFNLLKLLSQKDSRYIALKWVEKNIPVNSVIFMENNIPPISSDSIPPFSKKLKIFKIPIYYSYVMGRDWIDKNNRSVTVLFDKLNNADYVIINSRNVNLIKKNKDKFKERYKFYSFLEKHWKMEAFFPYSGIGPAIFVFKNPKKVKTP